jgi:hypothetical protein
MFNNTMPNIFRRYFHIFVVNFNKTLKLKLFIIMMLLSPFVKGQEHEYGFWVGASNYYGDLNSTYSFKNARWGSGFLYRYNLNSRMSVRAMFNYGRVKAADATNKKFYYENLRNLDFTTDLLEVGGLFEINFFKFSLTNKRYSFTPYLFSGISFFYYNPRTNFENQNIRLQQIGTEGQYIIDGPSANRYDVYSLAIPFGGGVKYAINKKWTISAEIGTRFTFTDYLDDVSSTYQNPDLLSPIAASLADRSVDQIGIEGRQRGTVKGNDRFNFYSIAFTYTIHTVKCPKISLQGLGFD